MNKHYFSDITDLFLKVKQEENIPIDANAKQSIKNMLLSKINEMKAADTYDELEPIGKKQSFWTTWKRQLIGVPASLVAVMAIVFAMSSLQPSIPKDDFSPRQNETSTTPDKVREIQEEQEFDRPLVKTAKKPNTDDQEEARTDRSLNTKKEDTAVVSYEEKPEEKQSLIDDIPYTAGQTFILQTPEDQESQAKQEAESEVKSEPIQETEEPKNETVTQEKEPETTVQETTITQDLQDTEISPNTVEPQETQTIIDQTVSTQLQQEPLTAYPVYVYKDKSLEKAPAFSEEKLSKLTKSDTPDLVSVYYVEKNQVVVEIEENNITKWYLFDNIDGTWTISKYEKFITEDVVK